MCNQEGGFLINICVRARVGGSNVFVVAYPHCHTELKLLSNFSNQVLLPIKVPMIYLISQIYSLRILHISS